MTNKKQKQNDSNDDWKVGDTILFNGTKCKIIGSNGSGSTIEVRWENGQRSFHESYGYDVKIEVIRDKQSKKRK